MKALWLVMLVLALSPRLAAGEVNLSIEDALPQTAFEQLGEAAGCRFVLTEGQAWIGPESGVRVTARLQDVPFWEAVDELARRSGYEPVFAPYRQVDGRPAVVLRRIDVRGEELLTPAQIHGPLLVRPRRVRFSIPVEQARRQLVPVQVAIEVEVFLEPAFLETSPLVFVTAVGLRARDEQGRNLARAGEFDPATGLQSGIGLLQLRFDAPAGIPGGVAGWRGLFRLVRGQDPQILRHEFAVDSPAPVTRPDQEQPATLTNLGPYEVRIQAATDPADDPGDTDAAPTVTVTLTVPRRGLAFDKWWQLYGFLQSMPPRLLTLQGQPWQAGGYAVWSLSSAVDADVAEAYRAWARFRMPEKSSMPARAVLEWTLPSHSEEQKLPVTWEQPLAVEPPAQRRHRRPDATTPAPAPAVPPGEESGAAK